MQATPEIQKILSVPSNAEITTQMIFRKEVEKPAPKKKRSFYRLTTGKVVRWWYGC